MLVVEKERHIEVEIRGPGTDTILSILRKEIPGIDVSDDDEYETVNESIWFKNLEASVTPGISLKVFRDNAGLTQAQLSEQTGIPIPHISGMENDKRPIGKASAKKFAAVFRTDFKQFL